MVLHKEDTRKIHSVGRWVIEELCKLTLPRLIYFEGVRGGAMV